MNAVLIHTVTVALLFGLLVLALNLEYGLTGLLNFGLIALYAVGAYSVVVGHRNDWPVWIGLVIAPVAGALLGVLMSLPVRRLNQLYWALMTLGVAEILRAVLENEEAIGGGVNGTLGIPPLTSRGMFVFVLIGLVALVFWVFERIRTSQYGRVMRAIREDELLARTLGKNVYLIQLQVMAVSGGVSGIAGAAYAHWVGFVSPDAFLFTETFIVWIILVVGGIGSNVGAVVGAGLIQGLLTITRFLPDDLPISDPVLALTRTVAVSVIMVLVILLRPDGIVPESRQKYRRPNADMIEVPEVVDAVD